MLGFESININVYLFQKAVRLGDMEDFCGLVLEAEDVVFDQFKDKEALHFVIDCHRWEMAKFLLTNSKDDAAAKRNMMDARDASGNTPFLLLMQQLARYNRDLHDVQELMELFVVQHGANVNVENQLGHTPLLYACRFGNGDTVRLLLEAGAEVPLPYASGSDRPKSTFCNGHKLMCVAIENMKHGCEIIQLLIDVGVSVVRTCLPQREGGGTLLHCAAIHGNSRCAQLLIDNGLDVNAISSDDDKKSSPLHDALRGNRDHDTIQVLLASGAKLNVQDERLKTPLHLAASTNTVPYNLIQLMLSAHAQSWQEKNFLGTLLMMRDKEGQTAFHCARTCENAQALLEHTTITHEQDDDGSRDILPWCHDLFIATNKQGRTALEELEEERYHHVDLHAYLKSFVNETLSVVPAVVAATAAAAIAHEDDDDEEVAETNSTTLFGINPRLNDFQRILATQFLSNLSTISTTAWPPEDNFARGSSSKKGTATPTQVQESIRYSMNLPESVCHFVMGYLVPADVMKRTATNLSKEEGSLELP